LIPESWEAIPNYDRTSPRTDSKTAFSRVRKWIDECEGKTHEYCITPDEVVLPRRVIDVGLDDGVVRLIEKYDERAPYISLSHCWGKVQIITSTKNTLAERMSRIDFEQLSATFRDAVLVTRRLGIKYIWIDSLCIIQDDIKDWEIESAKMADIYSNSYLTIAATHSPNGEGGLFQDTPDVEVSGTTPYGEPYRLFFRERIDHHLENSNLEGEQPTSAHYPLLTRAWVYQERMLSTRVLHFGHYELFYECRSDLQCECGGIRAYGSSDATQVIITKLAHSEALDTIIPEQPWHVYGSYYMAQLWRTMVASYKGLKLTKATDQLPALGGLAKHMASRRKASYVAGLWANTINDDLIWIVRTLSPWKRPRPTPRTAPTWSWASVETHVSYFDEILAWGGEEWGSLPTEEDRESHEHFAKVEECWVKPAGVDEYGAIAASRLRVRGLLVEGQLEQGTDIWRGQHIVTHHVTFPDGLRFPMDADYRLDEQGPDQVCHGTRVCCLRMSQIQEGLWDNLVSLVLRLIGGPKRYFERIGTLTIVATSPPVDPVGPMYASAEETVVDII